MKNQDAPKPENANKEPVKQERQKQEFPKRNTNPPINNSAPRGPRDMNQNREKEMPSTQNRDNTPNRGYQRDNPPRQNYAYQNSRSGFNSRVKTIETVDDIKEDIIRIEKEIELEIKEIKTMRLGL
jgi:hypothetical protein